MTVAARPGVERPERLPGGAGDRAVLGRAGLAREAATCWTVAPAYATSVPARLG